MKNTILTIVLPTFNEKENISPLLKKIRSTFNNNHYNYEILFVDDSSDETPKVIEKEIDDYPEIKLIHRKKKERTGLATAFIKGFEKAKGKYICCLDADLQHPPETISELLQKAIKEKADIVVATRYIKGGNAKGLGGIYRRAVSIGLKYFTQIIFIPTRKTSDPGSGFFLFKKELLKNSNLQPRGFKILIEILMRTKFKKIEEVPYKFLPRENDTSKAGIKQGIEFLKHLWFIFRTIPEAGRFFKFCIVGGSGVFVNLGTLYSLVEFVNLSKNTSWLIAVILSIFTNYAFNSVFTYGDKKSKSRRESLYRLTYYYVISFATIFFNFAIFRLCLSFNLHYIPSALIGIIASTIINFIMVTKFVWKINPLRKKSRTS